jgi:sortase (surface protein transpeptidase)
MMERMRRMREIRLALAAALLAAGCAGQPVAAPTPTPEPTRAHEPPATATPDPPPPSPPPPAPAADPVAIVVPAIGVDADVVPVGLNADNSMETPDFGLAGWYTEGPRPGDEGPAVIVAHVDSRSGPDVFYRLRDLTPGDEIAVEQADGRSATFVVESMEQTDKDDLPVDRIWNDTDQPVLRLITCGGIFDRSIGHYEDNIIVYASAA